MIAFGLLNPDPAYAPTFETVPEDRPSVLERAGETSLAVAIGAAGIKLGQTGAAVEEELDRSNTTPTGQRGSPMSVPPGTNSPATVGGRQYTGHAFDQMQGRGFTPTVVENAIQNGARSAGNQPGTFQHVVDGLKVITNANGDVITVIPK